MKTIQTRLNSYGCAAGPVDGRFGSVTAGAVRRFQTANQLVVDGVVTPNVWGVLAGSTARPCGSTTSDCSTRPFQQGSVNECVKTVQTRLNSYGCAAGPVDGRFGSVTAAAVMRFQTANQLPIDGVVTADVWGVLLSSTARSCGAAASDCSTRTFQQGAVNECVRTVQTRLNAYGCAAGPVDGRFGSVTADAVKRFQTANQLPVDGVVTPREWTALVSSTARPCGSTTSDCSARTFQAGSAGECVSLIQMRLNFYGCAAGPVDGSFNSITASAMERFETANQLPVDGVVPPDERTLLVSSTARPCTQTAAELPDYPNGWCDSYSGGIDLGAGQVPNGTRVIGTSVVGRPIWAEHWGAIDGPQIIVVGQVHGNECSPALLVQTIRAAPPATYGIWLIPTLNPDGYAAGARWNASGIDLNADGYRRSQPETVALMEFTASVRPRLTVHAHSPNGFVGWYGTRPYRAGDPTGSGAVLSYAIATRFASQTTMGLAGAGARAVPTWFLWQGQATVWPSHEALLVELFAISNSEVPNASPRPATRTKAAVLQITNQLMAAIGIVLGGAR